jgi:hypothetical protein
MAIREIPASRGIAGEFVGLKDNRGSVKGRGKGKGKEREKKNPFTLVLPSPSLSISSITSIEREQKSFIAICAAVASFGLLAMFGLNLALTQGAFQVRELKLQVIEMNELREASLSQVARVSAPERLAESAVRLGMVPSSKPQFLDLNEESKVQVNSANQEARPQANQRVGR